ncbi:MAG: hypothetical protein PHX62_04030 [Bacilli bacterium]|nr:hypothetical protein [Bacilli bacterium]
MEQYKIVEKVSEKIIADKICRAIYLKGSIARHEQDQFSSVDIYVIIDDKNFDRFLDKRLEYLSVYQGLLYHNFVYFKHPQVIGIYENGLKVNLFAVRGKNYSESGEIIIIFDPEKILANYQKLPLAFSPHEIGELLDNFCLNAREYYGAYQRRDALTTLSISFELFEDFASLFRIRFEAENAKMGLKNYLKKIDPESRKILTEIVTKLDLDNNLEAVKRMFIGIDSFLGRLPLKIVEHVNFDFYHYSKNLIMNII